MQRHHYLRGPDAHTLLWLEATPGEGDASEGEAPLERKLVG
jgi:hypothetical protein